MAVVMVAAMAVSEQEAVVMEESGSRGDSNTYNQW